jgi:hypothetical protein
LVTGSNGNSTTVTTLDRWQRVQREEQERVRESRLREDEKWSSWTGRWPLGYTAALLVAALVFLALGLVYRNHDAPLRRPDLPTAAATVTDRRDGKNDSATVRYTAEGLTYEQKFSWSGQPPAIGATTPIAFVPGDAGHARPVGDAWDPGYQALLVFAGTLTVIAPLSYVVGVLGARRRLRKRRREAPHSRC